MHPSSIPGGSVCGTFGRGAKEWIKKLHKHGIEYWQFLPLTPTDSTGSPYSSPSSFALNPWFLDIDDLIEKGFISISNKEELETTTQNKNHFDFAVADHITKKLGRLLLQGWHYQSEKKKIDLRANLISELKEVMSLRKTYMLFRYEDDFRREMMEKLRESQNNKKN